MYNTHWQLGWVLCYRSGHYELISLFPALTQAKNGENHRFLTVFQLLRSCTSTHPNEIQIICGHTLVRLPCKISAGSAHWELSNQLWRADTCVILGRTEPLFQPSKHPNLNCFQPFSKIYIRSLQCQLSPPKVSSRSVNPARTIDGKSECLSLAKRCASRSAGKSEI